MRPDDLEFLIARYADGSLDAQRSADLEAVLRRDAAAQAMLESYRAVDNMLAAAAAMDPTPQVQWDRFAAHISQQVVAIADAPVLNESFEEQISRLSSGDVSPQEQVTLEAAITADPQSRLVLAEYRSLDRTIDAVKQAELPQVRWPAFTQHVSSAIDRVEEASEQALRLTPESQKVASRSAASNGVLGRIGNFIAQPRRLAVAACVLLAASISLQLVNRSGTNPQAPVTPSGPSGGGLDSLATVTPQDTVEVRVGPSFDPGGESTVTSIQVGPPDRPGFDLTALADWAREHSDTRQSQSSVGKAATRPDDKVRNTADSGLFPSR